MRTSDDSDSSAAKDERPRKPRVFASWSYETDRFKLYADLVVGAFCQLLGIERRELATEAGMSPSYLSAILRHKPLTAEAVNSLDIAMKLLLDKYIQEASFDHGALPKQLNDASTLISVGLQRRTQIFMSMSRSVPNDPISTYGEQEQDLIAALSSGNFLRDRETMPEIILQLVRRSFPHLPAKELGFAYSSVGRAVLSASERDFETAKYTASLFELASRHYGASMAESISMFIQSAVAVIKRAECSREEREAILSRLNLILGEIELFSRRFPIPVVQVAHDLKLLAECLEFISETERKTDVATITRWKAEFQRASLLYDAEIERFQSGSGLSQERGHLLLNSGYCKMKSVGGGISEMRLALAQFVECNSVKNIAYTFKLLSMAHLAASDADTALRCARISVKIFHGIRPRAPKAEIDHAELHLRSVEESNLPSAGARREVLKIDDPLGLVRLYLSEGRTASGKSSQL